MKLDEKTVLVTGGNGFLGKFVLKELELKKTKKILAPTSKELDLRDNENCKKIVKNVDVIIHLAGNVGGIGKMREKPGDIFYDNIMMGTQLIHQAKEEGVEKFVGLGTVCSYPKISSMPFLEDSLWEGYPEETNAAYGLSKKMMLVQADAYRQQFGLNSTILFPTNLYGPTDNFEPTTSHVIPAIILKIFELIKRDVNWLNVKYGQVLLFNQTLPHGNITNKEKETSWSLNCRFKSVFTPYRDKKLGEFFEPITLRKISQLAVKYNLPEIE